MKIGDLVMLASVYEAGETSDVGAGIIVGFRGSYPVVYWNEKFPLEVEYAFQIKVVASRKKEFI